MEAFMCGGGSNSFLFVVCFFFHVCCLIHSSQLSAGEDVPSSMLLGWWGICSVKISILPSQYLLVTENLSATFLILYGYSFLGCFSGILPCGFICIVYHAFCVITPAAHEFFCSECLRIWTSANLFIVIS